MNDKYQLAHLNFSRIGDLHADRHTGGGYTWLYYPYLQDTQFFPPHFGACLDSEDGNLDQTLIFGEAGCTSSLVVEGSSTVARS